MEFFRGDLEYGLVADYSGNVFRTDLLVDNSYRDSQTPLEEGLVCVGSVDVLL
jgi:hypothetical protein